jgi:hypothetical protein
MPSTYFRHADIHGHSRLVFANASRAVLTCIRTVSCLSVADTCSAFLAPINLPFTYITALIMPAFQDR